MKNCLFVTKSSALVVFVFVLTACGFSLRQSPPLPDYVKGIAIQAPSIQSKMARALSAQLEIYQIALLSLNNDDAVLISLQPENLERRLLSIFPTGQVAEYELIYSVRYTVSYPNSTPLDGYVEVIREYQDDPDQVLAKSRELELVLSEMRKEAADRIIRLLPSQVR